MSIWSKITLFLGRILFGLGLLALPVLIAIGYDITSRFADFSTKATTDWKSYLVNHRGGRISSQEGATIPLVDARRITLPRELTDEEVGLAPAAANGRPWEADPVVSGGNIDTDTRSHVFVSLPGQERFSLKERYDRLWDTRYEYIDAVIWFTVTAIALGGVLMNASKLLKPGILPVTLAVLPVPGSIVTFAFMYFRSYLPKRNFLEAYSAPNWYNGRADVPFEYLAPIVVGVGVGLVAYVVVWASRAFASEDNAT